MALGRLCNFVWWFITRNAESEAEVEKLRAKLWQPPQGEAPAGPWAPEAAKAALGALQASLAG